MFELLGEHELDWDADRGLPGRRADRARRRPGPQPHPPRSRACRPRRSGRLRPMPVNDEDLEAAAARYAAQLPGRARPRPPRPRPRRPHRLARPRRPGARGRRPAGRAHRRPVPGPPPDDAHLPGARRRAQDPLARHRRGQARGAGEAARRRPVDPGRPGRGARRRARLRRGRAPDRARAGCAVCSTSSPRPIRTSETSAGEKRPWSTTPGGRAEPAARRPAGAGPRRVKSAITPSSGDGGAPSRSDAVAELAQRRARARSGAARAGSAPRSPRPSWTSRRSRRSARPPRRRSSRACGRRRRP